MAGLQCDHLVNLLGGCKLCYTRVRIIQQCSEHGCQAAPLRFQMNLPCWWAVLLTSPGRV